MPKDLLKRSEDASRFIQYHRTGIESSPLQVYYAPLIFSPSSSLTRRSFEEERPEWIVNNPMVDESWSACLQTFEGHSGSVNSVAWSAMNGNLIASGSSDQSVRIWDPATGQHVHTLEGHSDAVTSVSWSPDGSSLASGSSDSTVRIWDVTTGQLKSTLENRRISVNPIAWSPDGTRLALGCSEQKVLIWDRATDQLVPSAHKSGPMYSIAWSPDGSLFASGSSFGTILVWDGAISRIVSTTCTSYLMFPNPVPARGGVCSRHNMHLTSSSINTISWLADGSQLVSGSSDGAIRIWDPVTSQCLSALDGHRYHSINSIVCSPDGNRLALLSESTKITILDVFTGQTISSLEGHGHNSIFWSEDGEKLVSGSEDNIVRIWDTKSIQKASMYTEKSDPLMNMHTEKGDPLVNIISWSPDGDLFAAGCSDRTVRVWDPVTGQCVSIRGGPQSGSIDSIMWSTDGRRIASVSDEGFSKIYVWDPDSVRCESDLEGLASFVKFENNYTSHRHTTGNNGAIDSNSTPLLRHVHEDSTQPLEKHGYGLSDDLSWITCNGLNVLWLPPEYRPANSSQFSIHGATNSIAIVGSLTRVFSLTFSEHYPVLSS